MRDPVPGFWPGDGCVGLMKKKIPRLRRSWRLYLKSVLCSVSFRLHGFESSLVACDGRLPVLGRGRGTVRIGKRFVVRGQVAPCEISVGVNAQLLIGDRVFVNQGVVIAVSESVEIGDDSKVGDFSAIMDSNYHDMEPARPDKPRPVTIGKNVWLGNGVLVLPGSKIGDHTVVAARSVVKGELPPRVLAAGNPAQVVKELDIPDGWRRE
jgi:carbonic anhydrase/acetyltransferase-like protein (isoleucine patch superfamily)